MQRWKLARSIAIAGVASTAFGVVGAVAYAARETSDHLSSPTSGSHNRIPGRLTGDRHNIRHPAPISQCRHQFPRGLPSSVIARSLQQSVQVPHKRPGRIPSSSTNQSSDIQSVRATSDRRYCSGCTRHAHARKSASTMANALRAFRGWTSRCRRGSSAHRRTIRRRCASRQRSGPRCMSSGAACRR